MMDNFIEFLYSKFLQSDGVSTDSRSIEQGNLFFALRGPNFNANQYARQALEKGAAFAVVDDEKYADDPRIIVASDTLEALQELATFHRNRFKRTLLAITGSNGKTTTKELVYRVLSKKYIVHATIGNYNNHIGVPLTLLHIHPQVEIAVIEMGANHVGEIAELCGYANPSYGLITNIGEAHTETFGGIEGVLRGKSELFDHLRKTGGKPFINTLDERLQNMIKRFDNSILFPVEDLQLIKANPYIEVEFAGKRVSTQLIGTYNYGNIAAAVSVGREFGVSDEDILEAIGNYTPSNQRSQVIQKGQLQIINDTYNANPTSMRAALMNLSAMEGNKMAILGEMKEVQNSSQSHRDLGIFISQLDLDQSIFLGTEMKNAHQMVDGSLWFEALDKLNDYLDANQFDQMTVLIKASRSIKLEGVINHLK